MNNPPSPSPLITIPELCVLPIRQILHQLLSFSFSFPTTTPQTFPSTVHRLFLIPLFIPPNQQHTQCVSQNDLSRRTPEDQFTTRLVDGGFGGQEGVGADDVAGAVGEEDEGGGGDSFGVATDV